MIHIRQALHVPELKSSPIPVPMADRLAGIFVVGMRHQDLDSMLVVVDVQAVHRAVHGSPATVVMPNVLSWAYEALPPDLMDGPVTLVHVNFEGAVKLMSAGVGYRVTWTPVKWPGCRDDSLSAFSGAFPGYAAILVDDLEELQSCVH